MDTALGIVLLAVSLAGVLAVGIAFAWAARKDGEADPGAPATPRDP